MDKQEARKRIKRPRQEIRRRDDLDCVKNAPETPDAEHDELFQELQELEDQFQALLDSSSPTQRVGDGPLQDLPTVDHAAPPRILDWGHVEAELRDFDRRVRAAQNNPCSPARSGCSGNGGSRSARARRTS